MMRSALSLLLLSIAASSVARAEVESGPAVGAKLAALKVAAATGEFSGEEVDYAEKRKEKPTIYLFIQADRFDRPMFRYMKTLDAAVSKIGNDAQVVAVWVTGDVEKSKEYLERARQSLQFDQTAITVFPGEKSGPENWGLNDRASLTTVVAKGDTVAARFAYVSLNDQDVPAVEAALKKVIEEKK